MFELQNHPDGLAMSVSLYQGVHILLALTNPTNQPYTFNAGLTLAQVQKVYLVMAERVATILAGPMA